MLGLLDELKGLQRNIRVGIIGSGWMGSRLLRQTTITPGIDCVAIADILINRAINAAAELNLDFRIVQTSSELHEAISEGKLAVCENGELVAGCSLLDVLLESTNSISAGGHHGILALESQKHLIMVNKEADLMFGNYLMNLAQGNRLTYTACDGDEPAVNKRLINEVEMMGFEVVMAGNIKGYLDRYANPTSIKPEADKRLLDYRMATLATDGTNLSIEMALLANAIGFQVATPGMYGPRITDIHNIYDFFDFEIIKDQHKAVVDYVLGATPKGGVFIIGHSADKQQQLTLDILPSQMGTAPFFLFYRPYHLVHFEAMRTVAEVVLRNRPVLKPDYGFKTNVYAYAKTDLEAGDILDGFGGYTCYGIIENCAEDPPNPGLPICLANDVKLTREIKRDEKINMEDIVFDEGNFVYQLYKKSAACSRETSPTFV
jgi:predicted homoserine dehydrogenase-like protein